MLSMVHFFVTLLSEGICQNRNFPQPHFLLKIFTPEEHGMFLSSGPYPHPFFRSPRNTRSISPENRFIIKAHSLKRSMMFCKHHGRPGKVAGRTLKKKIHKSVIAILSRYDAGRIAIFGSYARGDAGNRSDIDIMVRFSRPKSLIPTVQIEDGSKKSIPKKSIP
jgi:hypothetical protein